MGVDTTPPFPNGSLSLSLLMERFTMRKGEGETLVGDCPVNHGIECTFDAHPTDLGWRVTYCELGCMPREIWAASGIDRAEPGMDEDEEPPKPNYFRDSYKRLTAAELDAEPPPLEFVLRPYVPAGTVSVLSGPGGSNKTTLTTYLAVCRALGRRMFDGVIPVEGETVILTTEDRIDDYRRKLAALREYMGSEWNSALVSERIHFLDLSGTPVRLVSAERGEQFVPTSAVDLLTDTLKQRAPDARYVIMETVSRLTGGVENNSALAIIVEAAQRVCRIANVATTLVTHVSQDAARNGVADAYASRGGSALGDNARSSMVLTGLSVKNREEYATGLSITDEQLKHTLVWTHPKGNGTAPTKPMLLWRESTKYGPVLSEAEFERVAGPVRSGRKPKRTYDELKVAIVEMVKSATTSITGNAVYYELGGTRTTFLGAVKELCESLVLQRGNGDTLLVRQVTTNSEPTEPVPHEPPGSVGSLSERERERPEPEPYRFGSNGQRKNRTEPPTEAT